MITRLVDPCVYNFAKAGFTLRKKFHISEPSAASCFYPRSFTHQIQANGDGPEIIMYGSKPTGAPVVVRSTGYFPYCYVKFASTSVSDVAATAAFDWLNDLLKSLTVDVEKLRGIDGGSRYAVVNGRTAPLVGKRWESVIPANPKVGFTNGEVVRMLRIYFYAPCYGRLIMRVVDAIAAGARSFNDVVRFLRSPETFTKPRKRKREADDDNESTPWESIVNIDGDQDSAEAAQLAKDLANVKLVDRPIPSALLGVELYDADLEFEIQFCIDCKITPEGCVEVGRVHDSDALVWTSSYRELKPASEEMQNTNPPQVILSIDCEMELAPNGDFPSAETERVLQICGEVRDPIYGTKHQRAFTLQALRLPSTGSVFQEDEVFSFATESAMLTAFSDFVRGLQPDCITGWNMEAFDFTYMLDRAAVLNLTNFARMTRNQKQQLWKKERTFESEIHGKHVYKEVRGEGIWLWDLFTEFKRSSSYKFRSYSLEAVSTKLLGDRKEDVAYSEINRLNATPEGRYTLARYCMKDAILPNMLMTKELLLIEKIELARQTGVQVGDICRRGMQVMVSASISRFFQAGPIRCALYTRTAVDRAAESETYGGAKVFEPITGLHLDWTLTLDFAALYPNIMRTFNMCLTTLLLAKNVAAMAAKYGFDPVKDVWRCPISVFNGDPGDEPCFVKDYVLEGMNVKLLTQFLEERKRVKKLMVAAAEAGDARMEALYNKRQLGKKLLCNSNYGFWGAASSRAFCKSIAAAVCAYGRYIIEETARVVCERYTRANGYPFDVRIIYGDTDSIFVNLMNVAREFTPEEVGKYGVEMADYVDAYWMKTLGKTPETLHLRIEFEKAFSQLLLLAKKRYAGVKYMYKYNKELGKYEMRCSNKVSSSGSEADRRDPPPFVSRAVQEVLDLLFLTKGTKEDKLERIRAHLTDNIIAKFDDNELPWSDVIQSKQYRKRPEDYDGTLPIHINVAQKLEERLGVGAPGTYEPGDRIQYAVVAATSGTKISACGEDPDYAWKNKLSLSRDHYIETCLKSTIARILEPVICIDAINLPDGSRKRSREAAYTALITSKKRKRPPPKREEVKSAVRSFVRVRHGCRVCATPIASGDAYCQLHADSDAAREDERLRQQVRQEREAARTSLWQTCQACVQGHTWEKLSSEKQASLGIPQCPPGDLEDLTPCENRSCDVFWKRRTNDRFKQ